MAISSGLGQMPVVRDLAQFPRNSGNWLERAVFNHRLAVALACLVATLVLGFFATRVSLNASFDKMIPVGHPYIQNYLQNRSELRGMGNTLRVVVENEQGRHLRCPLPRCAQAHQRRPVPHAGRGPRLGQVAVDPRHALDRGDGGGLPGRPGHARQLRRQGCQRRQAAHERRARGPGRQHRRQRLQVQRHRRAAAGQRQGRAAGLLAALARDRDADPRQVRARPRRRRQALGREGARDRLRQDHRRPARRPAAGDDVLRRRPR